MRTIKLTWLIVCFSGFSMRMGDWGMGDFYECKFFSWDRGSIIKQHHFRPLPTCFGCKTDSKSEDRQVQIYVWYVRLAVFEYVFSVFPP